MVDEHRDADALRARDGIADGGIRALVEQMQYVRGIPQVPGGYYTWRNINNAFYTITTDTATNNTTPREALMDKVYYINAEINYKRTEFGLPLHQTEDTTKEE